MQRGGEYQKEGKETKNLFFTNRCFGRGPGAVDDFF
jgi:hypothetical protein